LHNRNSRRIVNRDRLVSNALFAEDKKAREICVRLLEKALETVDPRKIVKSTVKVVDDAIQIQGQTFNLAPTGRILVVGAGKASGAMAESLEEILGEKIYRGVVNIPRNTKSLYDTERIELNEVGHPTPDHAGELGTRKMLAILSDLRPDDVVVSLISGGGSALMPLPAEGIDLLDKVELTRMLLLSGATIDEINIVRKHISAIKGGLLAAKTRPAKAISLIVSDVVGDPIDAIASGPTAPDRSTYGDAKRVLEAYNLWTRCPDAIRRHIQDGIKGKVEETPKLGDPMFGGIFNFIVANNKLALDAMTRGAEKMNLESLVISSAIEGEARHLGTFLAGIAQEIDTNNRPVKRPGVVVAGGESTVTVLGKGVGGRNQEAMLSAARKIAGLRGIALASVGTDGVDGVTNAAGAIIDGQTVRRAEKMSLSVEEYLRNNDSYNFFKPIGDLIFTGPTGTNVNDVILIVAV
jgi:glycerate-2-kinase